MPVMSSIRPETGKFDRYLGTAARALDAHLEAQPEDAMRRFSEWDAQLQRALPDTRTGTDMAIERLLEVVLPNGPRIWRPTPKTARDPFRGHLTRSRPSMGIRPTPEYLTLYSDVVCNTLSS